LVVEESDNVITVGTRAINDNIELSIQVPFNTSLKLHAVNGGDILVDHIVGDVEINNTNGNATATHISGAAVVHALNGKVLVSLDKVTADKPMSFSSLNGQIDVTYPPDIKATLNMKSEQGEIYSDFDIAMSKTKAKVEQSSQGRRGRYRISMEKGMEGTINGGGQQLTFKNFNGDIYIRKGK